MAPRYPWQRTNPTPPSSGPYTNVTLPDGASERPPPAYTSTNGQDRPIVVSATARAPQSPATGLSAASPSTLRIRNSPRNPNGEASASFSSERGSYPSPRGATATASPNASGSGGAKGGESAKGKGKRTIFGVGVGNRRRKDSDASIAMSTPSGTPAPEAKSNGWARVPDDSPGTVTGSPTPSVGVRKFDARGYPLTVRNGDEGTPSKQSYASGTGTGGYGNRNFSGTPLRRSGSGESLRSDTSTGAAVGVSVGGGMNGTGSGAGKNKSNGSNGTSKGSSNYGPSSYFSSSSKNHSPPSEASTAVPTPASLYPPVMNYSLASPSYSPAEGDGGGYFASDKGGYEDMNGTSTGDGYGQGDGYNGNGYEGWGRKDGRPSPLPSLYAQSTFSVATHATAQSGQSMTHFRKYDTLQDNYGAFSISSKGGQKHLGGMFSLPPDPSSWSYLGPEPDDDFHDPDVKPRKQTGFVAALFTLRGAGNIGCLALLLVVLIGLFAVYPITYQFLERTESTFGAYNLGGINATGQIPDIGPFQLIDRDTPTSAYTHTSLETGEEWELVFSDEFNNPGRTFWNGDDPYWEAADLHYWVTNNKEWYDPRSVTTDNGALKVSFTRAVGEDHGLNYTGGMITTWNRFCFTGGYIETAVSLPGKSNVYGLWPAIWTLGNLARAGYGGTTDGMWPYTYDSCDLGTLANQTLNGRPLSAPGAGDANNLDHLSYLPGQRLSKCTCPNDPTHPGPKMADGTWKGRGAPEIDVFEAVVDSNTMIGEVSQSAQWAPFNPHYEFNNASANYDIFNSTMTKLNPWSGSVWQQSTTALSYTDPRCYTGESGCYSVYGFEYEPGNDGYVTWINDGRLAWTVRAAAMGPNAISMVNRRPMPEEPMYLIINLGMSENFGPVDYDGLEALFPVHMDVDYIRVYQDPKKRNIGCSPPDFPTAEYIARYADVYNNPNITVMDQIPNFTMPKNRLIDTC